MGRALKERELIGGEGEGEIDGIGREEPLHLQAVAGGRGENVTLLEGNVPVVTLFEVIGAVQGEGSMVF